MADVECGVFQDILMMIYFDMELLLYPFVVSSHYFDGLSSLICLPKVQPYDVDGNTKDTIHKLAKLGGDEQGEALKNVEGFCYSLVTSS